MKLNFDESLISDYHSSAQIARVLTENWISENMYCPRCGNLRIEHFENNRPVADFYCPDCKNEYELKSKNGSLGNRVNDGAYETMIERITSNQNPDFFFMSYSKKSMKVNDFIMIPKHFFVPQIIEKRPPLSQNARRAGWVGCNILINGIPEQGRISIISNGKVLDKNEVVAKVRKCNNLVKSDINNRGWLLDILNCINLISDLEFTLDEVYSFEKYLSDLHPSNNNVKAKIRQQLQFLRDKGYIEFLGKGIYRKVI